MTALGNGPLVVYVQLPPLISGCRPIVPGAQVLVYSDRTVVAIGIVHILGVGPGCAKLKTVVEAAGGRHLQRVVVGGQVEILHVDCAEPRIGAEEIVVQSSSGRALMGKQE